MSRLKRLFASAITRLNTGVFASFSRVAKLFRKKSHSVWGVKNVRTDEQNEEDVQSPFHDPVMPHAAIIIAPTNHEQEETDQLRLKKDFLADIIRLENELRESGGDPDLTSEQLIEHAIFRLEEIIEKQGAEPISEETKFNCLRHSAVPPRFVNDGTPIGETLSQGWCIGKYVLRKAKVRISTEEQNRKCQDSL